MINYTGLAANPKLAFILDIKGVKAVSGTMQIVDVGWTYLPIFDRLQNENGSSVIYCNSGLHAVTLSTVNEI